MSNTDKRSKRAKNKAKKARLQKQKNIEKRIKSGQDRTLMAL
jgi:hypothetical protein